MSAMIELINIKEASMCINRGIACDVTTHHFYPEVCHFGEGIAQMKKLYSYFVICLPLILMNIKGKKGLELSIKW